LKFVTGTVFAKLTDAVTDIPEGWHRKGKSSLFAFSLDKEFGDERTLNLDESLSQAVSSLPSTVRADVALWLRPEMGLGATEVSFDSSMPSESGLESIWVEIERRGPGSGPDEILLYKKASDGGRGLIGKVSTSKAHVRQEWFNSFVANLDPCNHVEVELRSRSGGAGIVFDREVLRLLDKRTVHVTVSAITEAQR